MVVQKPIWILLNQETVGGSGIGWAICKSALRHTRATTPPTNLLQAGCPSCHPTNSVKALKARTVITHHHNRFTALFRDHPGAPVPEENFWTLWCKGRLTETNTPTIQLGATPSGLTSAHLHHLPIFFRGRMPFLPPNQQCQSTEGSDNTVHIINIYNKILHVGISKIQKKCTAVRKQIL